MRYFDNIWDEIVTWCHSGSDPLTLAIKQGLLYNFYAVKTGLLAPTNWHIPASSEYLTLLEYLDPDGVYNNNTAGGALKSTDSSWKSPNEGATNSTRFTALCTNWRRCDGVFSENFGEYGEFAELWTSTEEISITSAFCVELYYNHPWLNIQVVTTEGDPTPADLRNTGLSVRCIRDSASGWAEGEQVIDYDGNVYDTVQIGTQIYMVQNLAVKHLRDGTIIPEVTDNAAWAAIDETPAWCYYNNNPGNM